MIFLLILTIINNGNCSYLYQKEDKAGIRIQTSNKKLEQAFTWAVEMAISHVQTGKKEQVQVTSPIFQVTGEGIIHEPHFIHGISVTRLSVVTY
jgi:hypothetical protein